MFVTKHYTSTLFSVASAPSSFTAVQAGPTSIQVSWIIPTPLGDTNGYRVYYIGGSTGSNYVSGGSTSSYLLTGLENEANYRVFVIGVSNHLPSEYSKNVHKVSLSEFFIIVPTH